MITIENYNKIVGTIHYFNLGRNRLEVTEVVRNNVFNSYIFLCTVLDKDKPLLTRKFSVSLHRESLNIRAWDSAVGRDSSTISLSKSDITYYDRFVELFGPIIKELL